MKETHYRPLLAVGSFLFTGCVVQGIHHDTVTVIPQTFQAIPQVATPIPTLMSTVPPDLPLFPRAMPAPDPSPFVVSLPTSTRTSVAVISSQEVVLTIAVQQAILANLVNALEAGGNGPQGVITLQPGDTAATQSASPSPTPPASISPGNDPGPAAAATAGPSSTDSQTVAVPGPLQEPRDPAQGGFPGGNPPSTTVDLPVTIIFLLLYLGGAVTHISIYRANAKRGHKFLLSDLIFDFCMIRTLTCIFRIIWVFIQTSGIVLVAQIFFNGGAAVIFAVNILLTQRIVRSMHPKIGWSRPFSLITRVMAISVPVIIVLQIVSIIVVFFSVDDRTRLDAFDGLLKFGISYNLFLVTFPFWSIFLACAVPGPKPEKFGKGNLRVKTSLVMLAAVLLATGATIRAYAIFNPRPKDTDDVLYGKPVFYTTQFMMEIVVVAAYALLRFDLLFHIPNGSSGPGDYSMIRLGDTQQASFFTHEDIEDRISTFGVPYQILGASYSKSTVGDRLDRPVYAVFFPQVSTGVNLPEVKEEGRLPPRPPRRISRRDTIMGIV